NISVNQFEFFLRSAIKEREYFKFEFTKALSHSIELIAKAGDILGFDREQIKYLDVSALKASKYYKNKFDLKEFFSILIESNKEKHNFNSKIKLPPVIADEKDFKIIDSWISRPNFITDKKVIGEIVNLETETDVNLQNKIVMISKADPGYDWVFTKDIKGLITRYGGTASHMAIRSAEFDLPAAIGCGERLYKMIKKCNKIELNCSSKKILNLDNGGIYE
ncbi:MAG: PEP-utilizing enzyme, partial [Bacillota bacterium]